MIEKLISAPAPKDVVGLDVVKLQCRIEPDEVDEDALLAVYRDAAVQSCSTELGQPILPAELQRQFGRDEMGVVPVSALRLTAVSVIVDGAESDIDAANCRVLPDGRAVCAGGWPARYDAIRINYLIGRFESKGDIPGGVTQWVILRAATAYAHREAMIEGALSALPRTFVDGLLDGYRVY